jgi:hypothetical protein
LKTVLLALLAVPLVAVAGSPGFDNDAATVSPAIVITPPAAPVSAAESPNENPELAAPAALPPESSALQGFVIDYTVRYLAFGGKLTFALQQPADSDIYRITAETKAGGLTKLLMGNDPLEQAEFRYTDAQIVPLHYQLDSGKKSGEDNSKISFDWEAQTADSVYEGASATLQLGPDRYDRLSADIVVILDLRSGRDPRNVYVAEKNGVREYTFTRQGDEIIETPAGTFDTVRYLRDREGSSRNTLIWYARNADYLPVRMELLKHGKTTVTSEASRVVMTQPTD